MVFFSEGIVLNEILYNILFKVASISKVFYRKGDILKVLNGKMFYIARSSKDLPLKEALYYKYVLFKDNIYIVLLDLNIFC